MTVVRDPTAHTPVMRQYLGVKARYPEQLLFYRMGDFYELFGDDAVEAARILEITLTSRDKGKANPIPMAGVPHHSIQAYIQKLLKNGRKVAIGEQMEDPSKVAGKAIVKREIVRIFTPGVQFDLEGAEANYIGALLRSRRRGGQLHRRAPQGRRFAGPVASLLPGRLHGRSSHRRTDDP